MKLEGAVLMHITISGIGLLTPSSCRSGFSVPVRTHMRSSHLHVSSSHLRTTAREQVYHARWEETTTE